MKKIIFMILFFDLLFGRDNPFEPSKLFLDELEAKKELINEKSISSELTNTEPKKIVKPKIIKEKEKPKKIVKPKIIKEKEKPKKIVKPKIIKEKEKPKKIVKPKIIKEKEKPKKIVKPKIIKEKEKPKKIVKPKIIKEKEKPKKIVKPKIIKEKEKPKKIVKPKIIKEKETIKNYISNISLFDFLVIDANSNSIQIKTFNSRLLKQLKLYKKNKIVLDFHGSKRFKTRNMNVNHKILKHILVGDHPDEDFFRVVLSFRPNIKKTNINYKILERKVDLISIDNFY